MVWTCNEDVGVHEIVEEAKTEMVWAGNEDVGVHEIVEEARVRWYGHVMRLEKERIPKRMMETKYAGKRRQGRPKNRWHGRCLWGVSYNGVNYCSLVPDQCDDIKKVVVLSRFENSALVSSLNCAGYSLAEAAGAGYKLLCVADGCADAFVLLKSSTYFWDTCGPHALLRSMGGGILDCKSITCMEVVIKLFSGLVEFGVNPDRRQVRCIREAGEVSTSLEQGLANWCPTKWAGSVRLGDKLSGSLEQGLANWCPTKWAGSARLGDQLSGLGVLGNELNKEISYTCGDQKDKSLGMSAFSNKGGFVASRDKQTLDKLVTLIAGLE
uniref:Uncharacterized protein n=1 Tax=Timema shepardi TaxID=629360 RepID=A0A7R9ARZ8_TIMSH|nr:unnamed protein product [Timema shepardi]